VVRDRLGEEAEPALTALDADDREVLSNYPPRQVVVSVEARAKASGAIRRRRTAGAVLAVGTVAAAALLLATPLFRGAPPAGDVETLEATRIKGLEPRLRIYRQSGDHPLRLEPRDRVAAGDLLQVSYQAAGQPHGVIYSEDGAGRVTLHHPERGGGSTALEPLGEVPLPHAFELDDAPAFERFVFVTADAPLEVSRAVRLSRDALGLTKGEPPADLPSGWRMTAVTLLKEEP